MGPSGQNQLFYTPLLFKILDLTENKKIVNNPFKLISVFHCNETDDSLCSARGMGNVFEASPSDSPEQPGQDHRASDDSV